MAGVPLTLAPCDAAGGVAKWELQGNGQVKMAQTDMCVSQLGPSAAMVNAAAAASVHHKLDAGSQPRSSSCHRWSCVHVLGVEAGRGR